MTPNDTPLHSTPIYRTPCLLGYSWDTVAPHYRRGWEQAHANSGTTWEEQEPAYRYAWENRTNPTYRNRDWASAENDLRSGWEASYPRRAWDTASSSVREGWDTAESALRVREEQLAARR